MKRAHALATANESPSLPTDDSKPTDESHPLSLWGVVHKGYGVLAGLVMLILGPAFHYLYLAMAAMRGSQGLGRAGRRKVMADGTVKREKIKETRYQANFGATKFIKP